MSDQLLSLILNTLETDSAINDTRDLVIPGTDRKAVSQDDQITILGALNSLQSREVRLTFPSPSRRL
jgi:phenylalanyl-tRNA synthetase alpha chain